MSTDDLMREQPLGRAPEPTPERATVPEPAEMAGTPDAVKQAETARRPVELDQVRGRGVDWVRPTDLLVRGSGNLAGRGITFNVEQHRRVRATLTTGARAVSKRARRLPPVSAFGRHSPQPTVAARSGVGMR